MATKYHELIDKNLSRIFDSPIEDLMKRIPADARDKKLTFKAFGGITDPEGTAGDFSILLYPLPKIALCYIFYLPDEEFPPSVTCLYSANADNFMPLDGLADVGEYCSKKIRQIIDEV